MTADEIVRRLAPSDAQLAREINLLAENGHFGEPITPQGVRAWRVRDAIPWRRRAQLLALAKKKRMLVGIKRDLEALA